MTTCIDRLGPGPDNILCPSDHCDAFQETTAFHGICNCVDWQGNPIPNCSPKDNLYPVQTGECYNGDTNQWQAGTAQTCAQPPMGWPWYFRTCYCCCSCFATNTPVQAPDGPRALGDFLVGDLVLAASRAGDAWSWDPKTVEFSNGSPATSYSGPTAGNLMIYLEYGDGDSLIATPNQLFALPDGALKRADQLVPGTDSLAGADGSSVAISRMASGYYKGGVHHIATSMVDYEHFDGTLDGHLINANGVVVGDYLLQIFQDTPKLEPFIEQSAPVVGTLAYTQAHPDLVVKPYVVGPSLEVVGAEISVPDFVPHGETTTDVPDGATALFTPRQEAMLLDPDIPKRGFSDNTNVEQVRYFTQVFAGFYPDVEIVLDWESTHPNVYGYVKDGTQTVLVGGEFLRLGPLYGPAMAMAIGFGVAAATSDAGYPGRALYDGVALVLSQVLQPYWAGTVQAGQPQLDTLLTALAAKEEESGETPEGLSASCMAQVVDAAVSGLEVPPCAMGGLSVVKAVYEKGDLLVTFSAALDAKSAGLASNYHLTPSGAVTKAGLAPKQDSVVQLVVDLAPGSYWLKVVGVVAADGTPLNPDGNSASFDVPTS